MKTSPQVVHMWEREQAEQHVLNYGQRKVIDGMKLQGWDEWAKGEAS